MTMEECKSDDTSLLLYYVSLLSIFGITVQCIVCVSLSLESILHYIDLTRLSIYLGMLLALLRSL